MKERDKERERQRESKRRKEKSVMKSSQSKCAVVESKGFFKPSGMWIAWI